LRKILIAVCDKDGSYGEKLGEWISLQKGRTMQGVSFSSPERFLEYHRNQKQDIVLLGGGFCDDPQICGELLGEGDAAGAVFRRKKAEGEAFAEGRKGEVLWIRLRKADCPEQASDCIRELPAVEKYQPASALLREIFAIYQEWENALPGGPDGGREVIGVYSPGHSIWQTPFALTFAQGLAQKEKVLYINLKECAGFRGWFHEEYGKDLLDVMYLCLNSGVNVAHCISSALYTLEGVDYIPPAEDGGCLGEISAEDYLRFVGLLIKGSGYHTILLDFGMMVPGFFQLLGACSRAYIVTEPGELQKAPLQQFRQMAARQEAQLEEKLVYLSLPVVSAGHCPGEGKMQQWLWGAIGDFSRRLAGVQRGAD